MFVRRVRAIAVTVAMVIGAGTVTAVAAPLLRSETPEDPLVVLTESASEAPTESASEPADDPTESDVDEEATEPVGDDDAPGDVDDSTDDSDADEGQPEKGQSDEARGHTKDAKEHKAAKGAHAKPDEAGPPEHSHAGGNGHGEAVSSAARGETPPVGDCNNHGHWVSTVAKGLDSCDDNPHQAGDAGDTQD